MGGYRAPFAFANLWGFALGPGKGTRTRGKVARVVTVDESVQGFWTQVADALKDRISTQDWCSWFAGAGAVELGPERIVVEVVNEFAVRWVDQRFRTVLEQTVEQLAGVPLKVVIVAAAQAQAPADRPHEQLAQAARTQPPAEVAPTEVADADRDAPLLRELDAPVATLIEPLYTAGGGTVMTEAELRAELAGGDLLPTATLDAAPAAAHPGNTHASGGGAVPMAPVVTGSPLDAELAGVQQLNDRYRFETFVIGPGNQMVHAAALSVAETPAQSYNPLFVHGSTGLGKTHLLHAIGNYVRDTRPDAHVAYITTEQFLARFMHWIQQSKGGGAGRDLRDRFKAYFRGVDVLLMDDVQFLAGKGAWLQEELFHIFNALHENGRQIVLTSDCKPDRIPQLEDRLRSRFAWGLIADIETPDRDTRIAILRKKAQVDSLAEVPVDVLEVIAERVTTNVRELEGALTRVVAAASLSGRQVTLELAASVLDSYAPGHGEPVTIERIQDVVCEHFTIDRDELLSQKRSNALTLPRQIGMYLSRTLIGAPSTEVARRFNRKDHSTILHAERRIDERIRGDREVHDLVVRLTAQVRGSDRSVGTGR
ncbi:MAG: Chromosomal replication initiator protein DnaA [Thermoleophilia bacterium]|nr:Chromosomal replication initiator protein DnaA [Thermoleophilia bacterium]